jgi:hypothetical protein
VTLFFLSGVAFCARFYGQNPRGHIPVWPEGRSSLLTRQDAAGEAFRGIGATGGLRRRVRWGKR